MSDESVNFWKLATIGILLVGATIAGTLLVTAGDSPIETPESLASEVGLTSAPAQGEKSSSAAAVEGRTLTNRARSASVAQSSGNIAGAAPPSYPPQPAYPAHPAYPPQFVLEACNRYANEQVSSKTEEVVKNTILGAAIGAAVGAAGGAIAGGGSGAGKGAAIGGVTGAAGGTLYGLNEAQAHDEQYHAAYSSCMRSKGY